MQIKNFSFIVLVVCVLFFQLQIVVEEIAGNGNGGLPFLDVNVNPDTNEIIFTNNIRRQHQTSGTDEPLLKVLIKGIKIFPGQTRAGRIYINTSTENSSAMFITVSRSRLPADSSLREYTFTWTSAGEKFAYAICFPYVPLNTTIAKSTPHSGYWFSSSINEADGNSPFTLSSSWPMDADSFASHSETAFTLGATKMNILLEHLFFNTEGFALLLDDLHPWFIQRSVDQRSNKRHFCFSLRPSEEPYDQTYRESKTSHAEKYLNIKFRILMGKNIQTVHQAAVGGPFEYVKRPLTFDATFFKSFIWNFETLYKLTQKTITDSTSIEKIVTQLNINETIRSKNLPLLLVNFENIWHPFDDFLQYEETLFSQSFFNFFKTMSANKNVNFCLTISPWFPGKTNVQFENSSMKEAFFIKIEKLSENNVIFCKLAENKRLYHTEDELLYKYPQFQKTLLLEAMYYANGQRSFFSPFVSKSSRLATYTMLTVKSLNPNNLQQYLGQMLALSMAGYPLVAFNLQISGEKLPEYEELLMYLQLVIYTPALYLSVPYWLYKASPRGAIEKILKFSFNLYEVKLNLTQRWQQTGEPILRPMWYAAPDDPASWPLTDQFMLGPDIVVVPVIKSFQENNRKVYLPPGNWDLLIDGDTAKNFNIFDRPEFRQIDVVATSLYCFVRVVE